MKERRTEVRFQDRALAFVEIQAAEPTGEDDPRIIPGYTVDISQSGMQLVTRVPLAMQRIFRVFVDEEDEAPLCLVGEVRWCRPLDDRYLSGFHVYESEDSAYQGWYAKVSRRLRDYLSGPASGPADS